MDANEYFEILAKQELNIDTLELRGWDTYDFQEVYVANLKRALQKAHDAGFEEAYRRGRKIEKEAYAKGFQDALNSRG